ncbi:MAG: sulfite exporter TauE/SafE family protein [Gammaproteobacteria bacterium]
MGTEFALWQGIVLFLTGIAAGFVNVTAAGGSMLSVPVMVFLGIPGPVANGTNRIAILAQNITAVVTFFRRGYSDFRLSVLLALAAMPGAVIGALAGVQLEGVWFNRVLAVLLITIMIIMARDRKTDIGADPNRPQRRWLAYLLMFVAGLFGGFIQIGVGFIIMPALQYSLGLDLVRVNMHKTFVIGAYTTVALIVFSSQIQLLWLLGLCLAAGNSLGAWISARVQIREGESYIKVVLNTVLCIFIIKLLFFS